MPVRLDVNGKVVSIYDELCFLKLRMKGELRAAVATMFTISQYRRVQIISLLRSKCATSPLRKPTCEC
jgi:hypothetical protein